MSSLVAQSQLLGNQAGQLRLTSQPLVTNTGQILQQPAMLANPAMLSQLHMAMQQVQQPLLGSHGPTLLGNQPLYIRAAGPIQGSNIMGNVQAVAPAAPKGKQEMGVQVKGTTMNLQQKAQGRGANILPATTRLTGPQLMGGNKAGVQTNLTIQGMNIQRQPGPVQQKQVNRVKGIKNQNKPSSPVPTSVGAVRPVLQPKLAVVSTTPTTPVVVAPPKAQAAEPAKAIVSTASGTTTTTTTAKSTATVQPSPATKVNSTTNTPPTTSLSANSSPVTTTTSTAPTAPTPVLVQPQPQSETPPPQPQPQPPQPQPTQTTTPLVNGHVTAKATVAPQPQPVVTPPVDVKKEEPMEVDRPEDTPPPAPTKEPPAPPTVVEKQKAIVKPHILTHVIEGFIIQEGPEPFPVSS